MRIGRDLILLASFALVQQSFAQTDEQVPLRELCRRDISGEVIRRHDDWQRLSDLDKHQREELIKLEESLKQQNQRVKGLEEKMRQSKYNTNLSTEAEAAQSKRDFLLKQVEGLRNDLQRSGPLVDLAAKARSEWVATISPVFDVKFHRSEVQRGYPEKTDFKTPCPELRPSCRLNAKLARELKRMFKNPDDLERFKSCVRYAGLSGVE